MAILAVAHSAFGATLTVTPSVVSNTYGGVITIQVGGLTNGEAVLISKYVDANTNGVVDGSDMLVQSFALVDGMASVIGGVTNINVPGDYTPTNGVIVAPLNFPAGGVANMLAAQYAYVLTSTTGSFTPVTNLFNVTNSNYGQKFTGTVFCNGTNAPYATVMLFTPPEENSGMDFIGGTLADASGGYTVTAQPGTYFLMANGSGYIVDFAQSPVLTLSPGATVATNLNVLSPTRTLSGRVADSANTNNGLAGLLTICESDSGLAIGTTGPNGNFTVPIISGQWRMEQDEAQLSSYGYLRLEDKGAPIDATAGDVSGVMLTYPQCTALIYGSVRDELNQPLPGLRLHGNQNNGSGPYSGDATTDANGNYTMGVSAGMWSANIDDHRLRYTNYIFSTMDETNVNAGQAVLHNFVGVVATNHLSGFVRDGTGKGITNLFMQASATFNNAQFRIFAVTDTNGAYSMIVANGSWTVSLDCGYLSSLGFPTCPPTKSTNVAGADVVVNFTVSDLQIATTNLPDGTGGVFYTQTLSAGGGQPPYTWSLSPGFTNVPFGLGLSTNGVVSGTPSGWGSSGFSVRVVDNVGATADRFLNLNINPALLQITTTNLPNGTNNQFYQQNLNASGGVPPYFWYLPNGMTNFPVGLNLSSGGTLSGTPTTNGTFNFQVAVYVNNPYMIATQNLSVTIVAGGPQITTTSPLPTATQDSYYSIALTASGGQPPYTWSLAPASPTLPSGMSLGTNGVLSGTPTVQGGFWFIARVTDSALATSEQMLSLSINPPPPPPGATITAPKRLPNGQFQLSFATMTGTNYTIQYTTNLSGGWTPMVTIVGSGSPITIIDPNANTGSRFYRLKVGP